MKHMDIVALGEMLVDFVSVKGEDAGKIYLEGNAGGAPANVLAMAAKLGRKTAFIGKVGRDSFGQYLRDSVAGCGVDVSAMVSGDEPTTLAMVTLDKTGNRAFSFYRHETADVMLTQQEVDIALVEGSRLFHFGTVSMAAQPAAATTLATAEKARTAGVKISFDPNYRPFLWKDEGAAIAAMHRGLALANYVKVSDEEATLLSGEKDPEKAAAALQARYGFDLLCVTLGPRGCVGISPASRVLLPTYDVPTIDTTGAGDAFWGAVLHRLLKANGKAIGEAVMRDLLLFGNAAGSIVTTKHGAILPQPTEKEILHCIKNERFLEQ